MKTFLVTFADGAATRFQAHSISPDFSNGTVILMDETLAIEAVLNVAQLRFIAEEQTVMPVLGA